MSEAENNQADSPWPELDQTARIQTWKRICDAWKKEEVTVFPKDPEAENLRWFLRTAPYKKDEPANNVLFIGLNPSKAEAFVKDRNDGDDTTKEILEQVDTAKFDFLGKSKRLCIVNIVPITDGNAGRAKKRWREIPHQDQYSEINLKLCRMAMYWADYIIPMWGGDGETILGRNPNENPITIDDYKLLIEFENNKSLKKGRRQVAYAFKNKDGSPTHPYHAGTKFWCDRELKPYPFR